MIGDTLSRGRLPVAALCCTIGVATLAWAAIGALRVPRPRLIATLPSPSPPSSIERANPSAVELIERAIERDPFSATRQSTAPPLVGSTETLVGPVTSSPEALRLIGTVVDSSGDSFVLCQLGNAPSRVLRVGQELGPYQLRSISQGSAAFMSSDGQRLELRVNKTGG